MYKIQPLVDEEPFDVYCEMAIHGGGFTFLPRGFTRLPYAGNIVKVLFRDKKNVLLKLQKKVDRSEAYTLIQPHPSFANTEFGVLINSFQGYTTPLNAFMKEYIFLGIIPASAARHRSVQGFQIQWAHSPVYKLRCQSQQLFCIHAKPQSANSQ